MKKLILVVAIAFAIPFYGLAQVQINQLPSVDINISADTLVTADRFELNITITDNKGAGKAGIEEAERKTLIPILKEAGIDVKKDLVISNFNSYYDKKETVATKNYVVKVNSVKALNQITENLTKANILSRVMSAKVSNQDEILNNLRIKAIKSSRTNAETMLNAVNCKAGRLLKLNFNIYSVSESYPVAAYGAMLKSARNDSANESVDSYKDVRLSVNINASYEIINK